MAKVGGIDVGLNTRWINEFDGTAIDKSTKFTEGGRKVVQLRKRQKYRVIKLDCTGEWLPYNTAKQLAAIRDSGQTVEFEHNDGRLFNVLLNEIEGLPVKDFNRHDQVDGKFKLILTMEEL